MADLTIMQAIQKIQGFPQRVAKGSEAAMRSEFASHNDTGKTASTLYSEINGNTIFVGFPESSKGAYFVQNGRKAVRPVRANVLHWNTPKTGEVFTMYARPVKPDDFVGRTIKRIQSAHYYF